MGMGMGLCCCGDENQPPFSAFISSSSIPRTVTCSTCSGVLLPQLLNLSISATDGFDPYLNCTTKARTPCLYGSGGLKDLFSSPPPTLYSKGSSSCEYVTDCVAIQHTGRRLIANKCKSGCPGSECVNESFGPRFHWIAYQVGVGINWRWAFGASDPGPPCPPLSSRDGYGFSVMTCYENIAFSCNPFYHEFNCAFSLAGTTCLQFNIFTPPPFVPPPCEGCCISDNGGDLIKMKVVVS